MILLIFKKIQFDYEKTSRQKNHSEINHAGHNLNIVSDFHKLDIIIYIYYNMFEMHYFIIIFI